MTTRNNVIDTLREVRATLTGLLPADFLQENDVKELTDAGQLLYNVQNRLMGDNYQESQPKFGQQ
jgi:hypothetical protein